jgi:Protein ENHANCED DISEASE RESISTANCE 2, C-terminal
VAEGPWVVRRAVGAKPVLLGRLATHYFAESRYLEFDVDISASASAARVTSLVAATVAALVFDIGILIEARAAVLLTHAHVSDFLSELQGSDETLCQGGTCLRG